MTVGLASSKAIVLNIDGSRVATEAKDWEPFKGEWRAAMRTAASEAGATFSEQRGPAHPTGQPGTLVSVFVDDYRYISPGARYGFGIMTGNAFVDAKAKFSDLDSGQSFGERSYNTSSTAWQGVFSAMTAKQIEAICKDIVHDVTASASSGGAPSAVR
ncbi:MAG: hypothetical protein ABW187_09435 [Dokdonella sp.]